MAQTAVEMFAECLRLRHKEAYNDLYEDIEAYYKKIEKEQLTDAWVNGALDTNAYTDFAERYYQKTFGSSDQK